MKLWNRSGSGEKGKIKTKIREWNLQGEFSPVLPVSKTLANVIHVIFPEYVRHVLGLTKP